MAVVVQAQPWKALALIKYFDIIHRAYSSSLGCVWFKCDEMFHMRASLEPTLPWDKKEMELRLELVTGEPPLPALFQHPANAQTEATCCM